MDRMVLPPAVSVIRRFYARTRAYKLQHSFPPPLYQRKVVIGMAALYLPRSTVTLVGAYLDLGIELPGYPTCNSSDGRKPWCLLCSLLYMVPYAPIVG